MHKLLSIFSFVVLASCTQDAEVQKNHCNPEKPVLAGVPSKCMCVNDFVPDMDVEILAQGQGSHSTYIDIDNDKTDDIAFGHEGVSGNLICAVVRVNPKMCMSASVLNYHLSITYLPELDTVVDMGGEIALCSAKDTLSGGKRYWTPVESTHSYNSRIYPVYNGGFSITSGHMSPVIKDKYISVCNPNGGDTLYGWVHFTIEDWHLVIHDCAMQQKY
jgi:hypothetical protein